MAGGSRERTMDCCKLHTTGRDGFGLRFCGGGGGFAGWVLDLRGLGLFLGLG